MPQVVKMIDPVSVIVEKSGSQHNDSVIEFASSVLWCFFAGAEPLLSLTSSTTVTLCA